LNGVAPKAIVIPLRISNDNDGTFWESTLSRALLYTTNLKVSGALGEAPVVVNLSPGGSRPLPLVHATIDYAIANGLVVVASAGNCGDDGMSYPAAHPPVISVAMSGSVSQFPPDDPTAIEWILRDVPEGDDSHIFMDPNSSRALPGQDLDVAAPGDAVPVAWTVNGKVDYTYFWGTSAAAPHVAGVVALMLEKNPALSQAQIEAILESTALPLPPACATVTFPAAGPGNWPSWGDHDNLYFFDTSVCWEANATGHGLLQADAALAVP
jgi:subtilisin family serine protease